MPDPSPRVQPHLDAAPGASPLIATLESLLATFGRLLAAGREKERLVVENRLQELSPLQKSELLLSDEIEALEERRQAATRALFPGAETLPTLSEIVGAGTFEPADGARLRTLREKLRETTGALAEQNARNATLLSRAVEVVSGTLQTLVKLAEPVPTTYARPGAPKGQPRPVHAMALDIRV